MSPEDIKKIISEKVTGVWVAKHDATGHQYLNSKTGELVRSVTTIIGSILAKPHLIKWAAKMSVEWLLIEDRLEKLRDPATYNEILNGAILAHTDIRDSAGGIGTQAHNAIEKYIKEWIATGTLPADIKAFAFKGDKLEAIASMRAAEKWFKSKDIVPIAAEILVGNKYSAGQLDFLCLLNGKLTLIDHKTSNSIDLESYSLQVAAYKNMFQDMTGLKIKNCKILHLSKDYDKFTIWKVVRIPSAYKEFKMICSIYNWKHNNKNKIIKDIKRIKI